MSDVFITNLTTGDGQVATSATKITSGIGNHARRLNITFANVGGQEEVLILTTSRNGGTARRLKRVILGADEQLEVGGLPLNSTDTLLAQTTNASSVDYTISLAADDTALTMHVYDDKGGLKTAPYILEQLDAVVS